MKKCPNCNSIYSDDLAFCLNDGSALVSFIEQETVVIPKKFEYTLPQKPIKQGVSPIFAYLTIGLLALLVGGGAVAWIMLGNNSLKEESKSDNTAQKQTENTEKPSKTEQPKVNSIAAQNQRAELPPLTIEVVRNLINTWKIAQDTRNFSMYRDCYDVSFRGIKRTVSGSVSSYNYNQWLKDRGQMIKKSNYMDVRVDGLKVSIQGETATAEFDQYFRVSGYGDFGPKVMKIKMTENGAKVIYEELKSAVLLTD